MPSGCAVSDCNIPPAKKRASGIIRHRFPVKNTKICDQWLKLCNRTTPVSLASAGICSVHFVADDYERDLRNELLGLPPRKVLKKDAIPSVFPGRDSPKERQKKKTAAARHQRTEQRDRKKLVETLINESEALETSADSHDDRSNCIFLSGRCIFCLNRPDPDQEKEIKAKSKKLPDFSNIWPYIQPKWNDNIIPEYTFLYGKNNDRSRTPTMCSGCLEQVLKITEHLWKIFALKRELRRLENEASTLGGDLRKKTLDVPQKAVNLKIYAKRYKTLLVELLKEKAGSKVMSNTIVFLNQLRGCAVDLPEEPYSLEATESQTTKEKIFQPNTSVSLKEIEDDKVKIEPKFEPELYEDEEPIDHFVNFSSLDHCLEKGRRGRSAFTDLNDVKVNEDDVETMTPIVVPGKRIFYVIEKRQWKPEGANYTNIIEPMTTTQMCEVCGLDILLKNIYGHMKSHVGEFAYKCPNPCCDHTFLTQWSIGLLKHRLKHKFCWEPGAASTGQQSICEQCSQSDFPTTRQFGSHLMSHEMGKKNFACPLKPCKEEFTLKQTLEYHLHSAHDHSYTGNVNSQKTTTLQKCVKPSCRNVYLKPKKMELHLKERHQVQEVKRCKFCPFVFLGIEDLIQHLAVHCEREGIGIPCDICPGSAALFFSEISIRNHYYTKHGIGKRLICQWESCEFSCFLESRLRNHLVAVHKMAKGSQNPRKYECKLCTDRVAFRTENGLLTHNIKCHGGEQFRCRTCPKTFLSWRLKLNHEKIDHGEVKKSKYQCTVCMKKLTTKLALLRHITTLHKEGLKCASSEKSFKNEYYLKKHEKTHLLNSDFHHEMGVYKCTSCDKSFKLLWSLNKHKKYQHLSD